MKTKPHGKTTWRRTKDPGWEAQLVSAPPMPAAIHVSEVTLELPAFPAPWQTPRKAELPTRSSRSEMVNCWCKSLRLRVVCHSVKINEGGSHWWLETKPQDWLRSQGSIEKDCTLFHLEDKSMSSLRTIHICLPILEFEFWRQNCYRDV